MKNVPPILALVGVLVAACAPPERVLIYRDIRPPVTGKSAAGPTPPQAPPAPPAAAIERREAPPVEKVREAAERRRTAAKPERKGSPPQGETPPLARRAEAAARALAEGEERYRLGDWAEAGAYFGRALELLPAEEGPFGDAGRTRSDVQGRIRDCSERLMEAGLLRYRSGNLAEAIATWRRIEDFDPSFEDARRCIETATAQQRNLEKLN